jgi:predicted DNA-binding protein YlxM (UPF0122 family)
MAQRWGWSRVKVRGYMHYLSNRHQIVPQKNNVISLIKILNYNKYQTTDSTTERPQIGPQTVPILNKDNKVNKVNNIYISPERQKEIAEKYNIEESSVKDLYEDMVLYCKRNDKKYKDYESALMTWIRTAMKSGKVKQKIKEVIRTDEVLPEDQRLRNLDALSEMRNQLGAKLHIQRV